MRLNLDCWLVGAMVVMSVGCGGAAVSEPAATSQAELAEFLEANPRYAEPAASAKSAQSPLELGR